MDRIDGLAQVNLIVTDLERATEFWRLLGWQSAPRHTNAAVITFPSGMNLVMHEPPFARLCAAGYASSVEPWDTFFGARYAIIRDQDGHRVGFKSPRDPSLSYSLQ